MSLLVVSSRPLGCHAAMHPDDPELRSWLRRAVDLAIASADSDGGPFGAVVVCGGQIVSEGTNRVAANHDPTAHAEILALRSAGADRGTFDLSGCLLVSSCEPCPMCLAAAYWARVDGVACATGREDAAAAGFDDADLHRELRLPAGERSLRVTRHDLTGAGAPFEVWAANPDRVPY